MAPPVDGNGLALSTGTAGCSAYQIESKPRRSAFRAMKAGSMVYAGNGMDSPMSMSVAFGCCGRPKPTPGKARASLSRTLGQLARDNGGTRRVASQSAGISFDGPG